MAVKWIYYVAIFGPGHQSTEEGYTSMSEEEWGPNFLQDNQSVCEYLAKLARCDHTNWVINYWEVTELPAEVIDEKIKQAQSKIEYLNNQIAELERVPVIETVPNEPGTHKRLVKMLNNREQSKVLEALHKAGFCVSARQVERWSYHAIRDSIQPDKQYIDGILEVVRKVPTFAKSR